jgi:SAM-dependent methyltransferase
MPRNGPPAAPLAREIVEMSRDRAATLSAEIEDATFDNGAISRFNAWFFTAFAGVLNHSAGPHKRGAFDGLDAGTVLEIGAGTGANLRYLRPGTHLLALEPSRPMHARLRRRATAAGIDVTVLPARAEKIPLPDGSVDEVICSLVLCSVQDVDAVLAEVQRVLRPGGRFRFVEHVAAPGLVRGDVQRAIRRPWGWVFEGCDPHRATVDAIDRAGFTDVRLHARKLRHSLSWPINTAVWGIATR